MCKSQYLSKPEHDLYISYICFVTSFFLSLQLTYFIESLLENENMCKSQYLSKPEHDLYISYIFFCH